jgi:hypothetical protein
MGIKKCAAEMANELLDAEELEEHERVSKKQNGDDSFYSEKNMERLRKGIADLDAGKGVEHNPFKVAELIKSKFINK